MLRLYLVRHGLANSNEEHRYLGHLDEPIGDTGRLQALGNQERLSDLAIGHLFSSSLKRAVQTAEIIGEPHGLAPVPLNSFDEFGFGEWEGRTSVEIEKQWPGAIRKWFYDPGSFQIPGGEIWDDFNQRIRKGLERLVQLQNCSAVLVTHGGVLRVLFGIFLGLETPAVRLRVDHGGLSVVDVFDREYVVQCVNDLCHLPFDCRGDR